MSNPILKCIWLIMLSIGPGIFCIDYTACATVVLIGVEGALIIKRNRIPMSIAAFLVGIIGLTPVYFIVPFLF